MQENTVLHEEQSNETLFFPDLLPTDQCEQLLKEKKQQFRKMQIFLYIICGLPLIFYIPGFIFLRIPERTMHNSLVGAIVFFILAFICSITILIGIILNGKQRNKIRLLNINIQANAQYATFIKLGGTPKEAYKFVLEWLDRQELNNSILQAGAAVSASVIISQINHLH